MSTILTLAEALAFVKRDEDYDGEIAELLRIVDHEIEEGTGIRWQDRDPVDPIAKGVARLKLQLEAGVIPDDERTAARITYKMKQLQIAALRL